MNAVFEWLGAEGDVGQFRSFARAPVFGGRVTPRLPPRLTQPQPALIPTCYGARPPWLEYSQATLQIQRSLNALFRARGWPSVLNEDGRLGPRTCGAMRCFGLHITECGANCQQFQEMMCPQGAMVPQGLRGAVGAPQEQGDVGQFQFRYPQTPQPGMPIDFQLQPAARAVGPQRFQAPMRTLPVGQVEAIVVEQPPGRLRIPPRAGQDRHIFGTPLLVVARGFVPVTTLNRAIEWLVGRGVDYGSIYQFPGQPPLGQIRPYLLPAPRSLVDGLLAVLGLQRGQGVPGSQQARMLSGPVFEWLSAPDGQLGQPITFEQGHTYLSRWLVESPWPGTGSAPAGFPCDAGVDPLMQQIFAPDLWTAVVAKGFPPSGFPLPAGALPLPVPAGGECPVFTTSTWKLPTTDPQSTIPDPQALLALIASVAPGAQLFDMWDVTTQQKLVQGDAPALDLCPDGEIRDAQGVCAAGSCGPGTIMNRRSECVPAGDCPAGQTRNASGNCVTTGGGPGGTQPAASSSKKSSTAPIIAGALLLLLVGGGIALAR